MGDNARYNSEREVPACPCLSEFRPAEVKCLVDMLAECTPQGYFVVVGALGNILEGSLKMDREVFPSSLVPQHPSAAINTHFSTSNPAWSLQSIWCAGKHCFCR